MHTNTTTRHARRTTPRQTRCGALAAVVALLSAFAPAPGAHALTQERLTQAEDMMDRAVAYLRTQQDEDTGGWSVNPEGFDLPAISALVLTGMLLDPAIAPEDPDVARGIDYILSFRQADGGVYDTILPTYNTAIALSCLALVDRPYATVAIPPAQAFLRTTQWGEEANAELASVDDVPQSHPFYGGFGYGNSSRPDNSNLNIALQGLRDSGLSSDDEVFQRALVFLQRTQMLERDPETGAVINDMAYAQGSTQGGFIYATSPSGEELGVGESKAGMIDEEIENDAGEAERVSRLRAYGSITYAGFKSYLYADLERDDPRVQAAIDWIGAHYTLEENPGLGTDGLYYYYLTFARSLDAWGTDTIATEDGEADWASDLIERLAELQEPDGSFRSVDDRWMENNTVLITAYALLALRHATD